MEWNLQNIFTAKKQALFDNTVKHLSHSDLQLLATRFHRNGRSVLPKRLKRSAQTLLKFGQKEKWISAFLSVLRDSLETYGLQQVKAKTLQNVFSKARYRKNTAVYCKYFSIRIVNQKYQLC